MPSCSNIPSTAEKGNADHPSLPKAGEREALVPQAWRVCDPICHLLQTGLGAASSGQTSDTGCLSSPSQPTTEGCEQGSSRLCVLLASNCLDFLIRRCCQYLSHCSEKSVSRAQTPHFSPATVKTPVQPPLWNWQVPISAAFVHYCLFYWQAMLEDYKHHWILLEVRVTLWCSWVWKTAELMTPQCHPQRVPVCNSSHHFNFP